MSEGVFSIPYLDENMSGTEPFLNDQIISIMNTMKDWCCKNECDEILKGFVIYGYNLDSHLKLLKFPENVLQDHLYETSDVSHEMVIVYNAVMQVVLLIRIAQPECLENEMKLSTNDMIKFLLAFHDVLDKSGAKLINLVVTDDIVNYQSKCESCKHQIISIKFFSSSEVYQRWWTKKKQNFGISVIHMNLNKKFSFALSAKALGFVTFFQLSSGNKSQGTFPYKTIYMTPDKTKILYSHPKHIINGCRGLGKSVAPSKKTEILISRLQPNKSLHNIVCDSKQTSGEEIQLNPKLGIYMVMTEPEMTTIEQLLNEDTDKTKLNLIFDEFDKKVLKEVLAKKLNSILKTNQELKDSNIIVIHQCLQGDREEGSNTRKGNYKMCETISESDELICNMIDTTEHKLAQEAETEIGKTEKQVRKDDIQSNSTKGKFFIEDTEKQVENRSKSGEEEYPFDYKEFLYNPNEHSVLDFSKFGSIIIGSSKAAVPLKGKIGRTRTR